MRTRTALAALLVAALAGAVGIGIGGTTAFAPLMAWYALAWILFAAAVWALRSVPARHAAVLVLAGGALVAGTGLLAAPRTSDDAYRYVWDGTVAAQGISPYDHAPADPALARLRDEALFPSTSDCTGMWSFDGTCARINRPSAHTIYPPVAEAWFWLVHVLSFGADGITALQVGGWLLSAGTTLLLLRRGSPLGAALWAWCPAVPLEAVNNAHVDALGALLAAAAFAVLVRRRATGGVLLGAAIAAKLLPAVTLPGTLSGALRDRRPGALLRALVPAAAAAATAVLAYLPYTLWSRGSVLGYLGGYADEEGYATGTDPGRYAVLRLVLPRAWETPAVLIALTVLVLAAVCVHVLLRGDPDRPWLGALTAAGTALLLLTPGYAWYALLVVALAALAGRPEWLAVAAAGAATYVGAGPAAYPLAACVVLVAAVARGYLRRDQTRGHRPRRHPAPQ